MALRTQIETDFKNRGAFSLVEVLLAIAVFAMTIVAVLAMLGTTSQATSEVLNTTNASQIADAIREELQRVDFGSELVPGTSGTNTVVLYGSKDGNRMVLDFFKDNDPETGNPPGIYERDRFFLVTVDRLRNELDYHNDNAFIALSVRLEWPYLIPLGPESATPTTDPTQLVEPENRSVSIFNISIPRTF